MSDENRAWGLKTEGADLQVSLEDDYFATMSEQTPNGHDIRVNLYIAWGETVDGKLKEGEKDIYQATNGHSNLGNNDIGSKRLVGEAVISTNRTDWLGVRGKRDPGELGDLEALEKAISSVSTLVDQYWK